MTEKKSTKVYFRVCPMEKMVWDYLKVLDDHKTIYVRSSQQLGRSKDETPTFYAFQSELVFFQHSQKQIYDTIKPEIFDNISQNCDAIIIAYGQTGTGKSMTVNGVYNPYENRGILPRITTDLFKVMGAKFNSKLSIQVSYIEFVKMSTNDLLRPYPNHVQSHREATQITVGTVEDVLKLIFKGEGRKVFSQNSSYPSHSYSSIFTFHVNVKNGSTKTCRLIVVDLAGTNTVGNFSCLFKNPKEVGAANLAKSQLEQFFLVMATNVPAQIKVKLRLNPMIQFLGDSLRPGTILRAFGHIRVTKEDLLVTLSMLRFGQLIGGLKGTKFNVRLEEATREQVDKLQKELSRLRMETRYNSIISNRHLEIKSLSEDRFAHIQRTVNEYLQNKVTELSLVNVCDINIALDILKTICKKQEDKKETPPSTTKLKRLPSSTPKVPQKTSKSSKASSERLSEKPTRVASAEVKTSSLEKSSSFGTTKRPKTSTTSGLRRSSTGGRKSRSNQSVRDQPEEILPRVPPEYPDAWNAYLVERTDEYTRLVDTYRKNDAAAKATYKAYLQEIKNLEDVVARVDKFKTNLFLAKMTRHFNHANKFDDGKSVISEYEECCMKELQKAQQEKLDKQELVLRCQAELRAYINVCKEEKKTLNDRFNAFCREKYQAPVTSVESTEIAEMNVEDALSENEGVKEAVVVEKETEGQVFERLKFLVEVEKRKRKMYDAKHRQWLT